MDLNKPKPFNPNPNRIGKDWQLWKKEFVIYLKLSGGYEKYSEENRAYLLLNLMGTQGVKAMEQMTFDHPNEKNDMDILIMKFDEFFDPPLNESEERYKFFSRRKGENETIENFVADLKEKANTCNFGNQSDKFIIDMIIRNIDNYLREVIFALNDMTIPNLIQYYKQYSANNDQLKEISKNLSDVELSNKKPQPRNCWRCNTRHMQRHCPAYGTVCKACNEKNHFTGLCKKTETPKKKICSKCGTNHPHQSCHADSKKTEISQKRVCSKCGTNHPYQYCHADSKKTEIPPKRVCSKCGTNHPYQQCPAYDNTCSKCHIKGHYTDKCKNIPNVSTIKNEQLKRTMETKNKSTINQNEYKDLKHCLWCDSKHSQGQCQHDQNCTTCSKFPHKICFNCKKNPHEITCYYKSAITLPKIVPQTLNSNISNLKTNSSTENKNHGDSSNSNTTSKAFCSLCLKLGDHSSENCSLLYCSFCLKPGNHILENCPKYSALKNKQSTTSQSNNADPLLKDYVKVEPNSSRSSQYQGSTSYNSSQTKLPNNYRNNSQSINSQFKKNNRKGNDQKPDNCCIS